MKKNLILLSLLFFLVACSNHPNNYAGDPIPDDLPPPTKLLD